MTEYFQNQKRKIIAYLTARSDGADEYISDVTRRLCQYASHGKMIRGGLAVLGNDLFEDPCDESIMPVAAALELLQSALLIHDDIMDRDDLRRGRATLHRTYAREAAERSLGDPEHVGVALAICAGDIAFFAAFEHIAAAVLPAERRLRVALLVARELQRTGAAQMQDVAWGAAPPERAAGEADIIDLYRYKTARYSFSLPLSAGALAAGRGETEISILDRLGEHLGIIFQIKDDDLGLFGDEAVTGKPVGSDVREGKKTIMYGRLARRLKGVERDRFFRMFGQTEVHADDLAFVRDAVVRTGVREEMNALADEYAARCKKEVALLSGARADRVALLEQLLAYSLFRQF